MAKEAIKSEKITLFRGIFHHETIWLQTVLFYIYFYSWHKIHTVQLSVKRNHPFAYVRLLLWRIIHTTHLISHLSFHSGFLIQQFFWHYRDCRSQYLYSSIYCSSVLRVKYLGDYFCKRRGKLNNCFNLYNDVFNSHLIKVTSIFSYIFILATW